MLSEESRAEIAAWNARKLAQWERVKPVIADGKRDGPPLQLARMGEGKTTFMLTWSGPEFYEAVVFGRPFHAHRIPKNPKRPATKPNDWRDAQENEKPRHKQRIDLTDDEIDQVLALWGKGQSALALPSVASVWRKDGKEYVR